MIRPTHDEVMLSVAVEVARRGTCARRQVGCVLTDKYQRIVATGFNGMARGEPHCLDHPCSGAGLPSGTGLDVCQAIHAEVNALMHCNDVMKIHTCYTTVSPCVICIRALINTSCERIVFLEEYPHPDAKLRWLGSRRIVHPKTQHFPRIEDIWVKYGQTEA